MLSTPKKTSSFRITLPTELIRYLIETNNTEHSIPDICSGMICHMVNEMVKAADEAAKEADDGKPDEPDRKCWL